MSLKAFHIFFIAVAALTLFGFGVWCVLVGGTGYLVMGVVSFIAGIGLVIYGVKFLQKLKDVRYL